MTKLKPCPFCGSHLIALNGRSYLAAHFGEVIGITHRVFCKNCKVGIERDTKEDAMRGVNLNFERGNDMKKKQTEYYIELPGLIRDNLRDKQEFQKFRCTIRTAGSNTAVTIHAGVMEFTFQAGRLLEKLKGVAK